jgi:hypothetical protein
MMAQQGGWGPPPNGYQQQWQPQQYDPGQHRQRIAREGPPQWPGSLPPGHSQQYAYRQPLPPAPPPGRSGQPGAQGYWPPQPPHAPSRLPAYPRFPRLGGRSRRGPSLFRMVYLGTHPVALMMSLVISCVLIEVWAMVAMVVVSVWLLQCGIVAIQRAAAKR